MQRIKKQYWEDHNRVLKIYNYEYFLFSVKINCAIKTTTLKLMEENHTASS